MRKASDIGIINGKNQAKMKARIQEEKRTINDMQNFEPLEFPDVRVGVGVDVGVDAGVVVGAGIVVGVATGNDLGAGENAATNILRPLMDGMEDECARVREARVREAMCDNGNESDILALIDGGTSVE